MCTTRLNNFSVPSFAAMAAASFSVLSVALLTIVIGGSAIAADSQTSEDFGSYSADPMLEAQKHLETLGDLNTSVVKIDEAISNFYARTSLPASDDPIQQLLDFQMVVSAEREASRVLNDNPSESMLDYAYAIAPWLQNPPEPENEMLAERDALTSAIGNLNGVLKGLTTAIDSLY